MSENEQSIGKAWITTSGSIGTTNASINIGPKSTNQKISEKCDEIKEMLLEKNRKYGDSAIHPVRVFSKADPTEQIRVRLDDKLSRLAKGEMDDNEDVLLDLVGYLVLLLVARS